jgi:nucleoside-diphosphate-sugar epimerase
MRTRAGLVSSVIRAPPEEDRSVFTGNQIRDFPLRQNVADAFVTLLGKDIVGPVNIASGHPLSIRNLVYKIAARLGMKN